MLTNFHLPRSTLFMLVSAFSGLETMQRAYRHAVDSGYRVLLLRRCVFVVSQPVRYLSRTHCSA